MNFFKNDIEMLRRKPAQKQLGSSNLIKLYSLSIRRFWGKRAGKMEVKKAESGRRETPDTDAF